MSEAVFAPEQRVEKSGRQAITALPGQEEGALVLAIARAASDPTVDVGKMERLFEIHQKLTAQKAEREFTDAMARFKESAPQILKEKQVSFQTKAGGTMEYKHATLGAVCDATVKGLAGVGISHRWDIARKEGRIYVTCVLTHTGGHHTETVLDGAPDDSGQKNSLQQSASTITYLQRYTLLAATGLATEDQDNDGGIVGDTVYLSEDQLANIKALAEEVGANKETFLRVCKVLRLEDIPAASYPMVIGLLEAKRKQQPKGEQA